MRPRWRSNARRHRSTVLCGIRRREYWRGLRIIIPMIWLWRLLPVFSLISLLLASLLTVIAPLLLLLYRLDRIDRPLLHHIVVHLLLQVYELRYRIALLSGSGPPIRFARGTVNRPLMALEISQEFNRWALDRGFSGGDCIRPRFVMLRLKIIVARRLICLLEAPIPAVSTVIIPALPTLHNLPLEVTREANSVHSNSLLIVESI